jgi:hypothetical protein
MTDYILEHSFKAAISAVTVIVISLITTFIFGIYPFGQFPSVSSQKWQAVFLSNNQVYFGKLHDLNDTYVTLTNVYYLRTASDLDSGSNLNLIKLGGELHGPEDQMYIPKKSILFWEDMKDASHVVQSIKTARQ